MDNFKIFKNEIHILFPSPPRSSPGLSTRLTPGPSPRPTPGLPPHQLTRPPGLAPSGRVHHRVQPTSFD